MFNTPLRGAVLDLCEARNETEAEGVKHKGGLRGAAVRLSEGNAGSPNEKLLTARVELEEY